MVLLHVLSYVPGYQAYFVTSATTYYRCFVRMLTASQLLAHLKALLYFVRITLGLFLALPVSLPSKCTCVRIAHFCRYYLELQ